MNWFRKRSKSQAGTMGTRTMVSQNFPTNCGVHDPDTCLEVFKSHWKQTTAVIDKIGVTNASSGNKVRTTIDDVEAVIHYMDQMMLLLIEEGSDNGQQGPILQYMLTENVMERINTWCCYSSEHQERLKVEQLKIFDLLITESKQQLLVHKPIIRPLLHLLSRCAEHYNVDIKNHMILLLHQLCVCLTKNVQLVELFFSAGANHGPAKFLVFSLLIPYVHHEGHIGQQARDALLLIMALSSKNENIGRYIAENSDFCPVLATGLSGLYSSLPRKLEMPTDDWCQLTRDDWCLIPDLVMFLNSLEFCNAVVQVSHPLVRDQLLKYIYNGFLVPVLGPALHQMDSLVSITVGSSYFIKNSLEEVIAATAYLDLFIRQITEPALMQTFLKFILIEKHDEIVILDSLITRINSNSRLCMVSLALFKTMVDLNCEEVMFQLVFKYLIPCTHVMVSQKRSLKEIDIYSKTAEKFLSLTPACCLPEWSDSPQGTSTPGTPDPASRLSTTQRAFSRFGQKLKVELDRGTSSQASSPEHGHKTAFPPGSFGSKLEHYETNYMDYLKDSRERVFRCAKSCQCWSAPYDGENPSPESMWKSTLSNDKLKSVDSVFLNSTESTGSTGSSSTSATGAKGMSLKSQDVTRRRFSDASVDSLKIQSHGQNVGDSKRKSIDISARTLAGGISAINLPQDKLKSSSPSALKDIVPKTKSGENPDESEMPSNSNKSDAMLPKEVGKSSDVPTTPSGDSVRTRSSSCVSTPDDSDMSGFILTLKRVRTPVEICDNLEDSFIELDSLIEDLNIPENIRERSLSKRTDSVSLPNFTQSNTSDLVRPTAVIVSGPDGDKRDRSVSVKSDMSDTLCEFDTNASAHETLQTIPQQPSSTSREASPEASAAMAQPVTSMPTIPKSLMPFMQDKPYNMCTPNIGPFLSVLLHKLDSLMQNTLYVNLLLTGLITRLACYPQSLLRSFLLNHSLVFQPSIKSLVQMLGSVKHKIDCFSYTVDNFENLLLRGRRFLAWRENALTDDAYEKMKPRTESTVSLPAQRPKTPVQEIKTSEKRKTSISDFLFRRSPQTDKDKAGGATGKSRLERVSGGGYRYINSRTANIQDRRSEVESQKTKNAVYAAIVLEEFLKELAAISQEHSVLQADDGYASN
ncbi:FHF complex subunit HOOK-interacting protein 1B-like isoform X2 [Lineus longissimus]|uniref:FHF complex subunit HOOK-interacting protein 1B-like isoform X2 n=1 Tax=Lineus longissimus TaxID=88925 RepID=UPI00315CF7BE